MRETIIAATLAVLVTGSSVGCKSMPTMSWWKTASKDDAKAETLARSAPTLPSEIARQAEGLAAAQTSGGEAAPFVPGTATTPASSVASSAAPGAYPSTSAPNFSPAASSKLAANMAVSDANLGSLPYNPNAVPPATSNSTAAAPPAPVSGDRYASTAASRNSLPNLSNEANNSSVASASELGSRYGNLTGQTSLKSDLPNSTSDIVAAAAGLTGAASATPPASSTGGFANGAAGVLGDRYAQNTSAVGTSFSPTPASKAGTNNPSPSAAPATTVVASAAPYRPGGTSSYPSSTLAQPTLEVASRPATPTAEGSTDVPDATTSVDGEQSPSPDSIQVPRYR